MCSEHVAELSREAQRPGEAGGAGVRVRRGQAALLSRSAGRYGHKPGDFVSCLPSSSLPGTPLSSHQGTFERPWLDTMIMEAVEISGED